MDDFCEHEWYWTWAEDFSDWVCLKCKARASKLPGQPFILTCDYCGLGVTWQDCATISDSYVTLHHWCESLLSDGQRLPRGDHSALD